MSESPDIPALPTDLGSKVSFTNRINGYEGVAIFNEFGWWVVGQSEPMTAEKFEKHYVLLDSLSVSQPTTASSEEDDDTSLTLWRVQYEDQSYDCDGTYLLEPQFVLAPHEDEAWNRTDSRIGVPDDHLYTGVYRARPATEDEAEEWVKSLALPSVPLAVTAEQIEEVIQQHSVEHYHPEYGFGLFTTAVDEIAEALLARSGGAPTAQQVPSALDYTTGVRLFHVIEKVIVDDYKITALGLSDAVSEAVFALLSAQPADEGGEKV